MKFFVNNKVQQLRDQRSSVNTHTHTHPPLNTYTLTHAYDTEIIRRTCLYACVCTFITYKHMHTHASTHAGTDICMIMYACVHLYMTHKPSHVCLRVLVHL